MVCNDRGIVVTQKTLPRLCLIQPLIDLTNRVLILKYPGIASLQLNLDFISPNNKQEMTTSRVCYKKVDGIDCGQKVSDWLSQALGNQRYRLFRVFPRNGKDGNKSPETVKPSLSNHAQYSLVTRTSLKCLYKKVHQTQVTKENEEDFEEFIKRFRSNFVIDGGVLFEEKNWKSISIGSINFINAIESSRCQIICVNQKTAEKTSEPLATLFSWIGNKVNFGVYFETENISEEKNLCTGDEVVITRIK